MKKQLIEPEIIGGQGPLTKAEEAALSVYFASKKKKPLTGRKVTRRNSKKMATT